MKQFVILAGAALLVATVGLAQSMNASITGGGGDGKCTIEANVDATAEVIVTGTRATIRTLSGRRATLRRFQCNPPMPLNPANFRFRGIDGRGRQNLLGDPNGNGGRAIIRIDDPKGGFEGYTFDLEWKGTSNSGYVPNSNYPGGYYPDDRNADGYDPYPGGSASRNGNGNWHRNGDDNGNGNDRGNWGERDAINACQSEVIGRMERDGYRSVRIESGNIDSNLGNKEWIVGDVTGRRGFGGTRLRYECEVNLANGRLRNVHLSQR